MHIIGKLMKLKRLVKNDKKKTTFQNRRYMLVEKKKKIKLFMIDDLLINSWVFMYMLYGKLIFM